MQFRPNSLPTVFQITHIPVYQQILLFKLICIFVFMLLVLISLCRNFRDCFTGKVLDSLPSILPNLFLLFVAFSV